MTHHNLSMTYKEKLAGVESGEIRSTIRLLMKGEQLMREPIEDGDTLTIFTWSGLPYRSKWRWRREEIAKEVARIRFSGPDYFIIKKADHYEHTKGMVLEDFILKDGFRSTDLRTFKETLMKLNGLKTLDDTIWQVIWW